MPFEVSFIDLNFCSGDCVSGPVAIVINCLCPGGVAVISEKYLYDEMDNQITAEWGGRIGSN